VDARIADDPAPFHKPFLIVRRYPEERIMEGFAVIQARCPF